MIPLNLNDRNMNQPLKGSTVWSEVQTYIKSIFEALPKKKRDFYAVSTDQFISDFDKAFKGKYSAHEVAQLLSNGFEVKPGVFRFKYADFKEIKTPIIYNPVK